MLPDDRKYLKSHEWCKVDGDVATVGISDHAVKLLSDLVFLDLPEVGTEVTANQTFGEIESVKAVSDLIAPVSGSIVEINQELPDNLDTLGTDPWTEGWMAKIKISSESPELMDASAYAELVKSEE